MKKIRNTYRILVSKSKSRDYLGDTNVGGRIILNWTVKFRL